MASSKLPLFLSISISLLVFRIAVARSYSPLAVRDSNCCLQCKNYGCLVNRGVLTSQTPCDPQGKRGKATWMFCSETGCGGSCGRCTCEKMSWIQRKAVNHDIDTNALFYAYKYNEKTRNKASCKNCGRVDIGRFGLSCKQRDEKCKHRGECCGHGVYGCYNIRWGPKRCRTCYARDKKCDNSDQCCRGLTCRSVRWGPKRCRPYA